MGRVDRREAIVEMGRGYVNNNLCQCQDCVAYRKRESLSFCTVSVDGDSRRLRLITPNAEQFIVNYKKSTLDAALSHMGRMAANPELDLTFKDAATAVSKMRATELEMDSRDAALQQE